MLTQHIQEFLQVTPGPFPEIVGGAWGWGYIKIVNTCMLSNTAMGVHSTQVHVVHWKQSDIFVALAMPLNLREDDSSTDIFYCMFKNW